MFDWINKPRIFWTVKDDLASTVEVFVVLLLAWWIASKLIKMKIYGPASCEQEGWQVVLSA